MLPVFLYNVADAAQARNVAQAVSVLVQFLQVVVASGPYMSRRIARQCPGVHFGPYVGQTVRDKADSLAQLVYPVDTVIIASHPDDAGRSLAQADEGMVAAVLALVEFA